MNNEERDAIVDHAQDVERISWDAVNAVYRMAGMREGDPDGNMAAHMATIIARAIARAESS